MDNFAGMRIAVNTRFLIKGKMEGFGWFTWETVKRMALSHPEHEFIFLFDRPFDASFIPSSNVTGVVVPPPARHPLLFDIWYNYAITGVLRRRKVDVFYSPDGYVSLRTNVPQVAVIHDLNFEHHPEDLPKNVLRYLTKNFPLFAKKAKHIVTVSNFSKNDICQTYKIPPEKITVAYNGGQDSYRPVSLPDQMAIRNRLNDGKNYFIYVGSLHARKNLVRLFTAFDDFKQRTGSDTQLVIAGAKLWKGREPENTLAKMRFRQDVIMKGYVSAETLAGYVASARALVLVSYFEGFGIPVVEAMKCGTPVMCGDKTSLPEVAGDAALLVDPYSIESISSGLERIDKDEAFRMNLSQLGLLRAQQFSWDQSARTIWEIIERYVNQVKGEL